MFKFNPEQQEASMAECNAIRAKFIEENKEKHPAYVEAVKKLEDLNAFCAENGVPFFASLPFNEQSPGFMFYNALNTRLSVYDPSYPDTTFRGLYINGQLHMHNFTRAHQVFGVKMYDKAFDKQMVYNMPEE